MNTEENKAIVNGLISNHQEIVRLKKDCQMVINKGAKIDVIREGVIKQLDDLKDKDDRIEVEVKSAFAAIQTQNTEIRDHMADEEIHHLNVNNALRETNRILKELATRSEMTEEIKKLESRIDKEAERVTMGFKMAGYIFAGILFVLNMVWWFVSSDMRIVSYKDYPPATAIHKTYKVEGDVNRYNYTDSTVPTVPPSTPKH